MLKILAVMPLMGCLAACNDQIDLGIPPPPASYMVCEELPAAPELAPLSAIVLDDGREVYLKADVDARDVPVARYIVEVRGAWFSCSNQLERISDYYAAQ